MSKILVILYAALFILTACGNKVQLKTAGNPNQVQVTLRDHTSPEIEDPSPSDQKKTYNFILPLYPEAYETRKYAAVKNTPMTSPLYTATKKYIAAASFEKVMNWYKETFKAKGFTSTMSGQGNGKDGRFSYITESIKKGMTVDIGFRLISQNKTFISYYVKYVPSIKRSKVSLIKGNVSKVTIIWKKHKKIIAAHTLADSNKIHSLVHIMNHLQVSHPGVGGCGADLGFRYAFNFFVDGNDQKAVYNPACGSILFKNQTLESSQPFDHFLKQTFLHTVLVNQHVVKGNDAKKVKRIFENIRWKTNVKLPETNVYCRIEYRGVSYNAAFLLGHKKTAYIPAKQGVGTIEGNLAETLYQICSNTGD